MRVLWLIPARAGSKGLPHKNIKLLGEMPLLAWRIVSGLALDGEVWVSTDSEDYAAIARSYGATVPFLRPAPLATDGASSVNVCLHAMQHARALGRTFDALGLLQPTSPFVSQASLLRGIAALEAQPAMHSAIAVKLAQPSSAAMQAMAPTLAVLADKLAAHADTRRQALPQEITPCGGFYLARWEAFLQNPNFFTSFSLPVLLEGLEILDIDTELDLAFANFCLQSGRLALA